MAETTAIFIRLAPVSGSMKHDLREAKGKFDMEAARHIRLEVFVREQNVPPEIEMDRYDIEALHVLCLVEGRPVGTGRLVRMPDGMKLGRVAVLREFRSRGLGTGIVKWLLARAGDVPVYANVQITAEKFYRRMGFAPEGDVFLEAGIEHVRMTRRP